MTTTNSEIQEKLDHMLVAIAIRLIPLKLGIMEPAVARDHERHNQQVLDQASDALMSLFTEEMAKARLGDLEKMNNHYSLKGGHLLLYEENGKNVYLADRIASIKEEATEKSFGNPKEDKTEYEHLNRSVGQPDHQIDRIHDEQRQHSVLASLEQDKENK